MAHSLHWDYTTYEVTPCLVWPNGTKMHTDSDICPKPCTHITDRKKGKEGKEYLLTQGAEECEPTPMLTMILLCTA